MATLALPLLISLLLSVPCACASSAAPTLSLRLYDTPAAAATPPDFLGFSGVEASLSALSWRPAPAAPFAPRPSYTNLMRLLGGGVRHRFGHFYAPNSTSHAPSPSQIMVNATTCGRLTGALAAFNGTLTGMIAPLDLADGRFVAATGAALRACLGPALLSLEAANEPDISSFRGNYTGYVAVLQKWAAALEATPARGLLDAPVLAGTSWWPSAPAFLQTFAPSLRAFVQHRYGLTACPGAHAPPTPEALMRVNTTWGTPSDGALLAAVRAAGLPFVVGEANTVSCNGSAGVSDVFAAALYAVDASLSAAAAGISGFTWHGLGDGGEDYFYQPIFYDVQGLSTPGVDRAQPRPLFLGLWLLAAAGLPGGTLLQLSASATGSDLLRAWALRPGSGASGTSVVVVLLHKDAGAGAAEVTVVPAGGGCSAQHVARAALLLPGPGGLSSRAGCSLANQTFDGSENGLPVGERALLEVPCRAATGDFFFLLPAGSGAVLYLPV
jgi:hypothetical protein